MTRGRNPGITHEFELAESRGQFWRADSRSGGAAQQQVDAPPLATGEGSAPHRPWGAEVGDLSRRCIYDPTPASCSPSRDPSVSLRRVTVTGLPFSTPFSCARLRCLAPGARGMARTSLPLCRALYQVKPVRWEGGHAAHLYHAWRQPPARSVCSSTGQAASFVRSPLRGPSPGGCDQGAPTVRSVREVDGSVVVDVRPPFRISCSAAGGRAGQGQRP